PVPAAPSAPPVSRSCSRLSYATSRLRLKVAPPHPRCKPHGRRGLGYKSATGPWRARQPTRGHCMGKLPIVLGALVLGAAVAPAVLAQEAPHGALAVDEAQGYHFGFAHDYGNEVDAGRRASEECQEAGG